MSDHPVKPPRAHAARTRILAAARAVFAEVGYDRATVRMIAERASVVPAMTIRYFGSKAGVFAAAVQFDLDLPELHGVAPEIAGRKLVQHFLARWGADATGGDLVALLRASVDHGAARERMVAIFVEQLAPRIAAIVGKERARPAAALIASQMLGLAFCRYVLGLPELAEARADDLVERIGRTIASYLGA